MTDKKLITALRKACQDCNPTPCCEYEVLGREAADKIERLQSENARLKAELDKAVEDLAFNAGDGGCWKTCATHYCSTCNNGDNFLWRGLEGKL